jgi:L-lactate dehydrogenase (cytochrome)
VLEILQREADITMALCGERDVKNLGRHNIYRNELAGRQPQD